MPCQVLEWIQRILTIGAAFAGADGAEGLRSLLTAQAENFFRFVICYVRLFVCLTGKFWTQRSQEQACLEVKRTDCEALHSSMCLLMCVLTDRAYHGENLEGLHSMLEKELWQRIPSSPAGKQENPCCTCTLRPPNECVLQGWKAIMQRCRNRILHNVRCRFSKRHALVLEGKM